MTKKPKCSYSDKEGLVLNAPTSWAELSDEQFRGVLSLMGSIKNPIELKTRLFFYLCDITVEKFLGDGVRCSMIENYRLKYFNIQTVQIQSLIHQFDFVDNFDTGGRRFSAIKGCWAVDSELHGVWFKHYLRAEICFQGFLISHDIKALYGIFASLYRKLKNEELPEGYVLTQADYMNCFCWMVHIKNMFTQYFPHFFKPVPQSGQPVDMRKVMDAQIRALTKGDIVKEEMILQTDVWRALTELDALAQEAEEFERKYGKN